MAYGDRHICSTAIGKTAAAVDLHLTAPLRSYRDNVKPQTDLPPGTFGTVGDLVLGRAYVEIQYTVKELVGDAVTATESWERDLEYARRNWRTAEDLNTANASAIGPGR
ncbi:hypothetical protein [Nonomuraea sp. NPDC003804]|uniref:hypothetical protein n=1 Tax=Nonomuraea sp. NPDC003804 TaxID=3154547 RepID=UPI0033BC55C4